MSKNKQPVKGTHVSPADLVIHAFGGVRAAAELIKVAPSTISRWRSARQGLIPPEHIYKIMTVAKDMGISISPEDLILGRAIK